MSLSALALVDYTSHQPPLCFIVVICKTIFKVGITCFGIFQTTESMCCAQSETRVLNLLPLKFPDCRTVCVPALWEDNVVVINLHWETWLIGFVPTGEKVSFFWEVIPSYSDAEAPGWTVRVNNLAIVGSFSKKYSCIPEQTNKQYYS